MKDKIIRILQEINEDISSDENIDLLSSGMIDSFDVANLVAKLEETFMIEIDAEDIIPENFRSVRGMIALVEKYESLTRKR